MLQRTWIFLLWNGETLNESVHPSPPPPPHPLPVLRIRKIFDPAWHTTMKSVLLARGVLIWYRPRPTFGIVEHCKELMRALDTWDVRRRLRLFMSLILLYILIEKSDSPIVMFAERHSTQATQKAQETNEFILKGKCVVGASDWYELDWLQRRSNCFLGEKYKQCPSKSFQLKAQIARSFLLLPKLLHENSLLDHRKKHFLITPDLPWKCTVKRHYQAYQQHACIRAERWTQSSANLYVDLLSLASTLTSVDWSFSNSDCECCAALHF